MTTTLVWFVPVLAQNVKRGAGDRKPKPPQGKSVVAPMPIIIGL